MSASNMNSSQGKISEKIVKTSSASSLENVTQDSKLFKHKDP